VMKRSVRVEAALAKLPLLKFGSGIVWGRKGVSLGAAAAAVANAAGAQ
jgi:hypothetical protein